MEPALACAKSSILLAALMRGEEVIADWTDDSGAVRQSGYLVDGSDFLEHPSSGTH